jgi:inward rectifier potassium channel
MIKRTGFWRRGGSDAIDNRERRALEKDRETRRLLMPDGSSRVIRMGLAEEGPGDLYHFLMIADWWQFVGVLFLGFIGTNALFGFGYWLMMDQLDNVRSYPDAFFFSVQTIASIGYGHAVPIGLGANLLVTLEAFFGLLSVSVGAGLMFARVTRPNAGVMFSDRCVVARHDGKLMLMFRLANQRKAHIVEAHVSVVLSYDDVTSEGESLRRLVDLDLRRDTSPSFVLSWTVRHVIDEKSPLFGKTKDDLVAARAEILVVFSGFHESFNQTVHARHAYGADEIHWNHKLADIFTRLDDGRPALNFQRFHHTEPLESQSLDLSRSS